MSNLNPDFRSADTRVGPDLRLFGWAPGADLQSAVNREREGTERLLNDMPVAMKASADYDPLPDLLKQWNEFQKSKGRYAGSCDWSILDEFSLGTSLLWLPQKIGSCVVSNTLRGWVIRLMYQIVILGLPFEYLGRNEFGSTNYSFYAPYTYGSARRRGGMSGSDGLYADVMAESLIKDGVLSCNTPVLLDLLKQTGNNSNNDFPEPQNDSFYRQWGDWKYLDTVKQYADYALEECIPCTNAEQLMTNLKNCKTTFNCSMLAIAIAGTHKDGFTMHKRDPNNQWAHNMCFHGFFAASDGEIFFRFSNESWGPNYIYNIPFREVEDWFKNRNVTAYSMGMIRGPKSSPPTMA
jgi:hypothetical protein